MYYGCVRTYARKGTHTYSSDASPSLNHSAATKAEKHNTMLYVRTYIRKNLPTKAWLGASLYVHAYAPCYLITDTSMTKPYDLHSIPKFYMAKAVSKTETISTRAAPGATQTRQYAS